MQINSMNALYSSTSELAGAIAAAAKAPETQKSSATSNQEKPAPMYDLHHMSLNELSDMMDKMYSDGRISEDDKVSFGSEQAILEYLGGHSKDEKLNMLGEFQKQVDSMNAHPENKGVEHAQHLLDVLKGIDARERATIPSAV